VSCCLFVVGVLFGRLSYALFPRVQPFVQVCRQPSLDVVHRKFCGHLQLRDAWLRALLFRGRSEPIANGDSRLNFTNTRPRLKKLNKNQKHRKKTFESTHVHKRSTTANHIIGVETAGVWIKNQKTIKWTQLNAQHFLRKLNPLVKNTQTFSKELWYVFRAYLEYFSKKRPRASGKRFGIVGILRKGREKKLMRKGRDCGRLVEILLAF